MRLLLALLAITMVAAAEPSAPALCDLRLGMTLADIHRLAQERWRGGGATFRDLDRDGFLQAFSDHPIATAWSDQEPLGRRAALAGRLMRGIAWRGYDDSHRLVAREAVLRRDPATPAILGAHAPFRWVLVLIGDHGRCDRLLAAVVAPPELPDAPAATLADLERQLGQALPPATPASSGALVREIAGGGWFCRIGQFPAEDRAPPLLLIDLFAADARIAAGADERRRRARASGEVAAGARQPDPSDAAILARFRAPAGLEGRAPREHLDAAAYAAGLAAQRRQRAHLLALAAEPRLGGSWLRVTAVPGPAPAGDAGWRPGDIVVAVGGMAPVANEDAFLRLRAPDREQVVEVIGLDGRLRALRRPAGARQTLSFAQEEELPAQAAVLRAAGDGPWREALAAVLVADGGEGDLAETAAARACAAGLPADLRPLAAGLALRAQAEHAAAVVALRRAEGASAALAQLAEIDQLIAADWLADALALRPGGQGTAVDPARRRGLDWQADLGGDRPAGVRPRDALAVVAVPPDQVMADPRPGHELLRTRTLAWDLPAGRELAIRLLRVPVSCRIAWTMTVAASAGADGYDHDILRAAWSLYDEPRGSMHHLHDAGGVLEITGGGWTTLRPALALANPLHNPLARHAWPLPWRRDGTTPNRVSFTKLGGRLRIEVNGRLASDDVVVQDPALIRSLRTVPGLVYQPCFDLTLSGSRGCLRDFTIEALEDGDLPPAPAGTAAADAGDEVPTGALGF